MNCMATLKHIASKNSDYTAIEAYLVYQHDEFSSKVILDKQGRPMLRESYLLDTLECGDFSFATACLLSPASGIAKKDLQKRTLMQIFFIVFPSKKQLLQERKPLSKNRPSAAWFFLKGVFLLLSLIYFQTSSHTPVFHPV